LIGKHLAVDGDLWDAHTGHEAPVPPHPKDALLGWDLVTMRAILVQWTHCHVQETNLKWHGALSCWK